MYNNQRFQLDSSVGKGTCPVCGAYKRFSYYVDREQGNQILDYSVGMCDRKDGGCPEPHQPYWEWKGFRDYIKEFPNLNNDNFEYSKTSYNKKDETNIHYIDKNEIDVLKYYSEDNLFIQFLKGLGMADIEIQKLFKKMNVRVLNNKKVVFFYEDLEGRITRGKIFEYQRDGHKIDEKDSTGKKRISITDFHYELKKHGLIEENKTVGDTHLFGIHLLKDLPDNIKIGIVESEKSALLANHFFKDKGVFFMAAGSLVNINIKNLLPLIDRNIIIYPDSGTAFDISVKLNLDRIEHGDFKHEIIVKNTFEDKFFQNGFDLGDFISWNYPKTDTKIDFDRILMSDETLSRINFKGAVKVTNIKRLHANDGNDYYSRFYYSLSWMKKEERKKLLIDNEPIVEVDATAFHSVLLGKLFRDKTGNAIPDFLSDDVHSNLAPMLGLSRNDAKEINNSYWNSYIKNDKTIASYENKILFSKMDEYLKTEYPEFWKWIVYIKYEMEPFNGLEPHKNMSIMLMDRDVRLMDVLIKRLEKLDIKCIYVADAVYVKESVAKQVEMIFNDIFNKN
jgi:hypothetical protein